MMKVGILTYHRSHNYGTVLQAHALRTAIAELGHEAFFVDYWPEHQRRLYSLFSREAFLRLGPLDRIAYLKTFFRTLVPKLVRRNRFERFYRDNVAPWCRPTSDVFDAVVYGSDQIWRKQYFNMGYNPVYFGRDGFKTSLRVSYAASMGELPKEAGEKELVRAYIDSLDRISVRESDLQAFLLESGFPGVARVADPVFLVPPEEWAAMAGNRPQAKKPYLLFYDLQPGTFDEPGMIRFATGRGLEIVKLSGTAFRWPRKNDRTTAGPFEFLNLVFHADMVATSSFHGLAFSVLFGKPAFASFRSKGSRARSLLESFGLSEFLVKPRARFPENVPVVDVRRVANTVRNMRSESLSWISSALEMHNSGGLAEDNENHPHLD